MFRDLMKEELGEAWASQTKLLKGVWTVSNDALEVKIAVQMGSHEGDRSEKKKVTDYVFFSLQEESQICYPHRDSRHALT